MSNHARWDRNDFWLGLARDAGLFGVLIGMLVLFGWLLDIPGLKSISPHWVAMKVNTALGFVLAGLALWLQAADPARSGPFRRTLKRLLAGVVFLIGALSLFEYLAAADLGIDQLLFPEPAGAIGTLAPGRMSPASALCFMLLGTALLVGGETAKSRQRVSVLAILTALPALAAVLIYLYHTDNAYGLSYLLQLAVHTALTFLVLAAGLLCSQPEDGVVALLRRHDSGGVLARRLLPVSLLLPILIGWLKLSGADAGLYEPDFGVALVALSYVVMFAALVVWGGRFLSRVEHEREWMHASVAVSEARLRTLVSTIPDMIWLKDTDGVYLACNPAFERFFGAKETDIVGKTDYDFVPRELADFFRANDQAAIAAGGPSSNEEWITIADTGRRILAETTKTPMLGRQGELLGVLGIARDITQRHESEAAIRAAKAEVERLLAEANRSRRALLSALEDSHSAAAALLKNETALRESNALLQAFIMHSPIYAFIKEVVQGESRVLMASENYRDMIGIPGSQMVGKTMDELFPAEFAAKMTADDWSVVSRGEVLRLDEVLNGRSYTTIKFPVEIGEQHYLAGYTIDITERKQAEDQVLRMNAELELRVAERTAQLTASNKELEAFSYSVSHDLRAPLRSIAGFVELLKKHNYDAIDDKGRHYMDVIAGSAVKMGQLIDDILTFSRIGRTAIQPVRVDLDQLVSETVSMLRPQCEGRRIEWKIEPLPEVQGERTLLALVLQNLLSNAVKFTRPREVAVIEVGQLPGDDGEVVCFVRDNGVGFDMQYTDKLFGLFQRLHAQDEFEGTGVGLANVQRIIQRHGGRVWADSKAGAGATFYFSLPLRGGEHESASTHPAGGRQPE